ncbi:hypothetical protein FFLO_06515 [Filobasidium floriforme]|uniref:Uncharacterized protein n=1 Tax=Filobasidium floriforme TaxID=5210 RepID=A0A8K0JF89_9TREE|nr:uncharacterized protein HD553DRAFT_326604 [Filobasidium floriforme]KAG7527919.1 hypothetical protein FFLO_06515 [Filobasidium floriforme]KAH8079377.1 hypothetical protein HD553DRAFT_326604 [Filobasidium floriforme]
MTTSNLSNDIFLAIESNVSDALAKFSMDYDRWDGVDRQLKRLSTNPTTQQLLEVQNCRILKASIEKLTDLEKEHRLGNEQKATALKYTVRVWELCMVRQMALELTGKEAAELHRRIPVFVRILSRPSVVPKVSLRGCELQDEDFRERREWLAALLKTYGEISVKEPPVHDSELDAELEMILESSPQLERLAGETFSPLKTLEAGPEGSLKSTTETRGSTARSVLTSASNLFSRFTGSGSVSAYTRNTNDSNSGASSTISNLEPKSQSQAYSSRPDGRFNKLLREDLSYADRPRPGRHRAPAMNRLFLFLSPSRP